MEEDRTEGEGEAKPTAVARSREERLLILAWVVVVPFSGVWTPMPRRR